MSKTPNSVSDMQKPILLRIQGVGHVPSFKNTKMIVRIRGRPALITDPRKQKIMSAISDSFECQLCSLFLTDAGATSTARFLRSWTASRVPLDDCVQVITSIAAHFRRVPKGQEGAEITIERL